MVSISALEALLWSAMAGWLMVAGLGCYCVYRYQSKLGCAVNVAQPLATVVIIPVRGVPRHLESLWRGLCAQQYRAWRLIWVVESLHDPAHGALSALLARQDAPSAELLIAGAATDTGQKVHNLLTALTRLRPEDRIVVFADADIIPPRDWLTRIVAALAPPKVAAVSGYRWLVPDAQNLATLLVCAANASIATLPRLHSLNHAWGGTMALRRETLDALHMESVWQGSISDDLPLTTALKARGEAVVGPRELLLPTRVAYDWRGGLGFARRQYLLLRIYAPGLWALAATGTTLPLIGWATAVPLALAGDRLALAVIVVANALDQARALLRRRVVGALWGEEGLECMRGVLALDRWATPLCLGFHAAVIWSTLIGRTIEWADRIYRIESRQRLRLLRSPEGGARS
ncbi:MAG: glycosyltransferase family 2 protein [Steroidobacteraceae bacterium]